MTCNETEILEQLDLAFNEIPGKYFPTGQSGDMKYNFFLDLEHGYFVTAGSRIHLYADTAQWAIVFEKNGYQNRGTTAEIELTYIGNCIDYPIYRNAENNCHTITNSSKVTLIDPTEFERIENKVGTESKTFELIGKDVKEIKIRDKYVPFDNNYKNYEKVGIAIKKYDNPNRLIGFGDLIRYLHETNPTIISATEDDIRKHIPNDIPKLMTIDEFHYADSSKTIKPLPNDVLNLMTTDDFRLVSIIEKTNPPSQQETYKLIARILAKKDSTNWKPTQKPNNSWKNQESGYL
jgi:hypothetical protein